MKTYLDCIPCFFRQGLDAAKDVVRMTGQMGVPVLLIGTAKIVGFDKARIDRLLGLKGS